MGIRPRGRVLDEHDGLGTAGRIDQRIAGAA
jgi:hypothetical protein